MKPSGKDPEMTAAIEQQSAAWVLRRDRGLTAAEQDEYSQWLAIDSRHGVCFAHHARGWGRLEKLSDWKPAHSVRPNPDLLAARTRRAWFIVPLSVAMAAAVVALYFGLARRSPSRPSVSPGLPPIAMIEQRTLEDGSVVQLNRGAQITVHFASQIRWVRLERGEAHFKVAKNPARPFIVDANGVRVRAVGTAFDVRCDGAKVDVLVTEGRVRVDDPALVTDGAARGAGADSEAQIGSEPIVEAGQRAVISTAAGDVPLEVASVSAETMDKLLSWQPKLLDFTAVPLSEIVGQFNRHNTVQLTVADSDLASMRMSASFRSDNVEGFVSLLESSFGVHGQRRGPNLIVLSDSR